MKGVITGVLAGVVLAGCLMAAGCHGGHFCGIGKSPQDRMNWMADKLAKELSLNADQKVKLDAIKAELLKKKDEFKADRKAVQAEIKSQILSDKIDQEKLNQLFAGRQPQREEMRKLLIAKFAEFHAILTPAQRTKLAELLEKLHGRFMPEEK
jgi:Spy/CpxP family protein refolding chaperone